MKLIYLSIVFVFFNILAQAQVISNIQVTQDVDNLIITYDLQTAKESDQYNFEVKCYRNKGTEKITPISIIGDIKKVSAGTNKKIINSNKFYWKIKGILNYPKASLIIYNRWGNEVKTYESNISELTWDGTNSMGQLVESGTYYYVLDFHNERKIEKGFILKENNSGNSTSHCDKMKADAKAWGDYWKSTMLADKNGQEFNCASYESAKATAKVNADFYYACPTYCTTEDCDKWAGYVKDIIVKQKELGCNNEYYNKYISTWKY
jgi:gliding motility-associated-like protein